MKVLLFPIDMSECDDYLRVCQSIGVETISASSEDHQNNCSLSGPIIKLPYINENNFFTKFQSVLEELNISHVYSPHSAIWQYINNLIEKNKLNKKIILCGEEPLKEIIKLLSKHNEWAEEIIFEQALDKDNTANLSLSSYSALHRNYFAIPGQSDEKKLTALCKIFRNLTNGDILEIGSLYGRSAFALAFLAKKFSIGNLICIDPWENIEDQGESATLLNVNQSKIDYNKIFQIFLSSVNVLDNVGYIRKKSEDALVSYVESLGKKYIYSEDLGVINLNDGFILIHIDGNHSYENVKKDVELWTPLLKKDGWLLLDDYLWAFGDGPYRCGNELIESGNYKNYFVSSDTLFLQKI